MVNNKLRVERLMGQGSRAVYERNNSNLIEYRAIVCVSHTVDANTDEKVPFKYIAAYVVNCLREFVLNGTLETDASDIIYRMRRDGIYTCPSCGSDIPRRTNSCTIKETEWLSYGGEGRDTYRHSFSCGHTVETFSEEPPNFCEVCGARVRQDGKETL